MEHVMSDLIKYALGYVKLGCFVFPCKLNKSPMTPHGYQDASNDRETVKAWWTERPDASIGIACGATGWLVLDVDPDKGGFESYAELRDREIITPGDLLTFTTRTGSGGMHIVWLQPEGVEIGNSAGKLGQGLDVRGYGGYIIAPPSPHPSGNAYQIELNAKPQPAPARLVELLKEKPVPPQAERNIAALNPKGALKHAVTTIVRSNKGARNTALSNQAWFLLHLVKDGSIPLNVVTDTLGLAGKQVGLTEREIQATLMSKTRLVLGG